MRNTILLMFAFICILAACKKDPEPSKVVISDTKIWTTVSPSLDMEDVSVFSDIKLIGLHAINRPIHNVVDKSIKGYYKIQLDEVKVYTDAGNLEGDVSTSSDTVVFKPKKCLPANTKIYVQAKAHYETKDEGEKEFSVYMVDGKPAEETYEYSFTTVNFDPSDIIDNIMPSMTHPEINLNDSITVDLKYKNNQKIYFEWNKPDSILLNIDKIEISSNGLKIATINSYSKDSDRIVIKPIKTWIPSSDVTLKIYNSWTVQNNKAKIVLKDSLKPITYSYSTVSSNTINSLKQEYLEYEYPVNGQLYLLKNECSKGYIKLRFNLPNIINTDNYNYSASIIAADSTLKLDIPITYDANKSLLEYPLPIDLIKNSKIYKIDFLRKNKSNSSLDTIHTTYFRTSKFNTFTEKVNSQTYKYGTTTIEIKYQEPFDLTELNLGKYTYPRYENNEKTSYVNEYLVQKGMVKLEIIPNTKVSAIIDKAYNNKNVLNTIRDISTIETPPYNAAYVGIWPMAMALYKENFYTNSINTNEPYLYIDIFSAFTHILNSDLRSMNIANMYDVYVDIKQKMYFDEDCYAFMKYVLPDGTVSSKIKILAYKKN